MKTDTMPFVAQPYWTAGYPYLALETFEDRRFLRMLREELVTDSDGNEIQHLRIAANGGLQTLDGEVINAKANYGTAFKHVAEAVVPTVLVVQDFHHIASNAPAYRPLLDAAPALKARGSMVILLAPTWKLPPELRHEIPRDTLALPSRDELGHAVDVVTSAKGVTAVSDEERAAIVDAGAGLGLEEAESAIAKAAVIGRGTIAAEAVAEEKLKLISSTGYLEAYQPGNPDDVGGLSEMKRYLIEEVVPVKDDAQLRTNGIVCVGPAGTGKSLFAKAVGTYLGWSVVRGDISAMKGSLVGQSEANMKEALRLIEAISPCVFWLDELEKAIGGAASSANTDGGTLLGMLGILITWLQENTKPVLVVATCNDYSKLPPELTRAGRFDERFFVDLPTEEERAEISRIHMHRYMGEDVAVEKGELNELVSKISHDWSGAEIEQLIKSAARRTQRNPTAKAIKESAKDIRPLSKVKGEEIAALREWAKGTMRRANAPVSKAPTGRKVKTNPKLN